MCARWFGLFSRLGSLLYRRLRFIVNIFVCSLSSSTEVSTLLLVVVGADVTMWDDDVS